MQKAVVNDNGWLLGGVGPVASIGSEAITDDKPFDVFLSHSRHDRTAVEMLARRLVDEEGLKPWLDKWSLVPGKPWQEALEEGLDTSRTCAVFIGPGGLGPWENEELRSALDQRVRQPEFRVILVLLPGAAKPERGSLPRFLSRLTWVDFSGPQGLQGAEAFRDLVAGIHGVEPGYHGGAPIEDRHSRRELLAEVKTEIASRLAQSLHSGVAMNLLKEALPQAVSRPWDVEVKLGIEQRTPLAPQRELIDVFDQEDIAGKLLILGAPGAGKTTTLLHLAKTLVDRAEAVAGEPMPVLLNLSSWTHQHTQTIASWMVTELRVKYGVRQDIGKRWLERGRLLPLLDGLDEVDPACLENCVKGINEFQQDMRPEHLVVCCRLPEYDHCETKLQLNGAIYLHSLTQEQIRDYLLDGTCPELWTYIHADPQLLDLARSPLLLSMMIMVYKERALRGQQRLSSSEEDRQSLFDRYIECMLARPVKGRRYGRRETLRWLTWLAQQLRAQGQTAFFLERVQPSWLDSSLATGAYRLCTGLVVAVLFLLLTLSGNELLGLLPEGRLHVGISQMLTAMSSEVVDALPIRPRLSVPLMLVMAAALIAGLYVAVRPTIAPVETLKWSGAKAWTGMAFGLRHWLIAGVKYGAYFGLTAGGCLGTVVALSYSLGFEPGTALAQWGRRGQVAGVTFGVSAIFRTPDIAPA